MSSVPFPNFVGSSYTSLSKYAAIERTVNFFIEVTEDPEDTKKNNATLYPTPCAGYLSGPATGAYAQPSRGLLELNGKLFGVNGNTIIQYVLPTPVFPNGIFSRLIPTVQNDGNPVSMIANGVTNNNQQVFISSADKGYIYVPSSGGFVDLAAQVPGFIAGNGAAFLDDFFISLIPGTNGFQISKENDGSQWDAADVSYTQGQSDTLVNLIADREYLWLFGNRRSEIWYNQGGQFFPFAIQPGAFMEIGLGAKYSLVQADSSLFWIGQDKRGGLSAWRANGLTPLRVSNHAVETAWSKYSTVSDCVSYSFLWRGHIFVRFIFPTAKAAWTYDATASQQRGYAEWHENSFTDSNGDFQAPVERSHAYVNGVHVVGSGGGEGNPGTLYQFTDTTIIDADPVILLRYSNDGGNTFGSEIEIHVGKIGEYTKRAIVNLLGNARDRVFWARCVDYGDCPNALGAVYPNVFPVTRDRICPHLFENNNRIYYDRLEIECQKGIGNQAGQTTAFWALVNAYLTFTVGTT